tara:strand:+ start:2605 stop:2808 length:204 start_codon:yes stop_codon:yes gene_type:complete
MHKVLDALREATISTTCLLDEGYGSDFDNDVTHILNQLQTIKDFLEPFTVAELDYMTSEETNSNIIF